VRSTLTVDLPTDHLDGKILVSNLALLLSDKGDWLVIYNKIFWYHLRFS